MINQKGGISLMSLLIKYNNKSMTIEKHLQLQFIFIFCSFFSFFFCLFGILFSYFGKNHYLNRIFKQAQSKINLTDVLLTDNWKSLSGHSVLLTRLAKTTLNNSQICHVPIIKHRLFQSFNCFIYHFIFFFYVCWYQIFKKTFATWRRCCSISLTRVTSIGQNN